MGWQLIVLDGAEAQKRLPLPDEGVVSIGNNRRQADIFVQDLQIAQVQCELKVTQHKVLLRDAERSTGTFVNGKTVKKKSLHFGDLLRLGQTHLRLEPTGDDAVVRPSSNGDVEPPLVNSKSWSKLIGHNLSHFHIGSVIGKGYAGTTFRARDNKSGDIVALKIIDPIFPAEKDELQQFANVLRLLLPFSDRHCVKLFHGGKSKHYCWMALEYVEGESLAQRLTRSRHGYKLDWRDAVRMGIQIGRGLVTIHQQKQIHGNITPKNILIDLVRNNYKLNDFLLSKAIEGSELTQKILEPKLLDELPYLAPEQTTPEAFVDKLSDIYGLGAVMYAHLTGAPPFLGESTEETLEQINSAPLEKPSNLNEEIPPQIERVIIKMLDRHQEDRYQSAIELVDELQTIADAEQLEV